jgi:hypothetical protein
MENKATVPFAGSPELTMRVPWRGLVTSLLLAALLCVFTLAAQTAKADSITFNDTTSDNIVSESGGSTRVKTAAACGTAVEICSITLAAPGTTTFKSSALPPITYIGEGNGNISDELIFAVSTDSKFVTLTFLSDSEGPTASCASVGGCTITESGVSQLAGSIIWSDLSTDSINFASDPGEAGVVPEPTSLLLLGSGLTLIGGYLRRRG